MDGGRGGDATPRLVFGLVVMVVGLMLTLDNFGVLDARRFWRLWPVILIGLGLSRLSSWARTGGRPEGIGLLVVGLSFLLINFGVIRFRQLFPLLLLGFGAFIVLRAVQWDRRPKDGSGPEQSARIDAFVLMSGVRRASSDPDFRVGRVSAIMGGCEIDLRQASIQSGPAVFDTFALWGGIEIRVPDDWTVEIQGNALLGGFDDSTRRPADERKKLIVTGLAIMGGVEVKN